MSFRSEESTETELKGKECLRLTTVEVKMSRTRKDLGD